MAIDLLQGRPSVALEIRTLFDLSFVDSVVFGWKTVQTLLSTSFLLASKQANRAGCKATVRILKPPILGATVTIVSGIQLTAQKCM